jgi:monoamine oxidase
MVGAAGGSGALYQAAATIGLIPDVAEGGPVSLPPLARTDGERVVILGAGIGGLTAALELSRAGYDCVILEASHRAGGRNMTLRAGSIIDEIGARRVCEFDDHPDLYFNAGPARIPSTHQRLVGYCRELEVPLQPFVNENRNAWIQDDRMLGGRPIRNREYVTDIRGFMSELLAKSVNPSAMEADLTPEDAERIVEFARAYGDLDPDLVYRGSERAGAASGGMLVPATEKAVYDMRELLKSNFWRYPMHWGELPYQSPMMMQPVGGMDRVVAGFMRKVGHLVKLKSRATSVHLRDDGVDVGYVDERGDAHQIQARYCLSCMPSHILAGLDHNFPAPYVRAMTSVGRGKLFKIGLQARERFWEREDIYGGITWTFQDITQIWYPSHGIHNAKGVLLGAYTFPAHLGEKFGRMTPEQRIAEAIRQGERVHAGYGDYIETGVSVAWHRMNHMLGCAARWDEQAMDEHFATLCAPVGNHFLIGDQVSYHPGWQEGAMASALKAVEQIDQRVRVAG